MDKATWPGRILMQVIKEKIAVLNGASEHSVCDSADLSSPPTSAQLTNCDIRTFDLRTLGHFAVVMADPPWPIHMSLPYGTIRDDELLNLPVEVLSEQGLIFLWVTMRAMEPGRPCIRKWGYEIIGEVIWVKMNQLNKTIVTGSLKGPSPSPFR